MKAGVLFSGGKDSALAALLLSRDYEVELNSFVFSAGTDTIVLESAARVLSLPWKRRVFPEGFLEKMADEIIATGCPHAALQEVHETALDRLSRDYEVIADGTRMDDRVPMLGPDEVRSLQDRTGCSYIRPILGYGRREIERLGLRYFGIAYGETGMFANGDYEQELQQAVRLRGGEVTALFPRDHRQSLIMAGSGVKKYE
jgi:predicted subunit of tRNA(5-methylaminomethyl-2-thiouridylate) methyltransferase